MGLRIRAFNNTDILTRNCFLLSVAKLVGEGDHRDEGPASSGNAMTAPVTEVKKTH